MIRFWLQKRDNAYSSVSVKDEVFTDLIENEYSSNKTFLSFGKTYDKIPTLHQDRTSSYLDIIYGVLGYDTLRLNKSVFGSNAKLIYGVGCIFIKHYNKTEIVACFTYNVENENNILSIPSGDCGGSKGKQIVKDNVILKVNKKYLNAVENTRRFYLSIRTLKHNAITNGYLVETVEEEDMMKECGFKTHLNLKLDENYLDTIANALQLT